jgi:predicted PurR-regulated permease PerM
MVTWLSRRRVPVMVGAAFVLVVDLLGLGALGALFLSAAEDLQQRLPGYTARLSELGGVVAARLGTGGAQLRALLDPSQVDGAFSQLAQGAFAATSFGAVVLFVVFFTLCEAHQLKGRLDGLSPHTQLKLIRVERVLRDVRSYLVVKCFTSALCGALTWLVLDHFDLPLKSLLALLMFTMHFVPNLGALVGAGASVAVAAAERGAGTAFAVGVAIVLIAVGVGSVLEPHLTGRAVRLSPLMVLLGMLFWGWLWGPAGALLSVPLMVAVRAALEDSKDLGWIAQLLGARAPNGQQARSRPALRLVHGARAMQTTK